MIYIFNANINPASLSTLNQLCSLTIFIDKCSILGPFFFKFSFNTCSADVHLFGNAFYVNEKISLLSKHDAIVALQAFDFFKLMTMGNNLTYTVMNTKSSVRIIFL